jgi:hypothetical protein
LLVEVGDAAHGRRQKLRAVVEGQEPGRQRRGHLIGVTNTVDAGKAILPEKLLVTEGQGRAVEDRQGALVLILDLEVVEPGLEGLEEAASPKSEVALKAQPRI